MDKEKNMKKLVIIIMFLLLLCFGCFKPYLSGVIKVHHVNEDKPEIDLNNPLGEVELGAETKHWSIFVRHTSSIPQKEQGCGLNSIGTRLKIGGK